MKKWLTAFILLLAMAGGALAGTPLHSGEKHCPMNMEDCCETAHSSGNTPQVSTARLCCALNCGEPGATAPVSILKIESLAAALHQAAMPPAPVVQTSAIFCSRSALASGQTRLPAYIRHLALLI